MNKRKIIAGLICFVLRIACIVGYKSVFRSDIGYDSFEFVENDIQPNLVGNTYLARLIRLREGSYELTVDYSAETAQNVYLVEEMEYDNSNENGKTIACFTLPAGENLSKNYTFDIDGFSKLVTLYVDPADGGAIGSFAKSRIESIGNIYNDTSMLKGCIIAVIISICTAFVIKIKNDSEGNENEIVIAFAAIMLVCFLSNWFYLTNSIVYGNDIRFHINRVEGICQSILNHDVPQKLNMAYNGGYGYANPIFYPELFLYIPAVFLIKGMSIFGALKLFQILINVTTAIISYYSAYRISQNRYAAIIACAVYTLSNYRMQNVYARFAMGEALFMTFLPLAVYGLYSIFYEERKRWLLFAAGVSAILQSHVIGFVLTIIILSLLSVLFMIDVMIKKKIKSEIIYAAFKSIVVTVLVNLWFVVPFLYHYSNNLDKFNMFDKDYNLQLFVTHMTSLEGYWSWNIVEANVVYNVGPIVLVCLAIAVVLTAVAVKNKEKHSLIALFLFIPILILGYICTDTFDWSSALQNDLIASLAVKIQFIFRLNSIMLIFIVLIIAFTPGFFRKRKAARVIIVLTVLLVGYVNTVLYNTSIYVRKEDNRNVLTFFRLSVPEYLPKGINLSDEIYYSKHYLLGNDLSIIDLENKGTTVEIEYSKTGDEETYLKLPRIYYEGYSITEGSDEAVLKANDEGFMEVVFKEGKRDGNIRIEFGREKMYSMPLIVSFIGIPAVLVYALFEYFHSRKKKPIVEER